MNRKPRSRTWRRDTPLSCRALASRSGRAAAGRLATGRRLSGKPAITDTAKPSCRSWYSPNGSLRRSGITRRRRGRSPEIVGNSRKPKLGSPSMLRGRSEFPAARPQLIRRYDNCPKPRGVVRRNPQAAARIQAMEHLATLRGRPLARGRRRAEQGERHGGTTYYFCG
jgi:hypothetical protein